jgi:hypothetical protein
MAAEAYHKSGNDPKARGYVNDVRTRSGLIPIVSAGAALFTDIVRERQLELAFEGFRFPDLVRWGMATAELGPLGYVGAKHSLLPIPDYDVKTGGLVQNPGY